MNAVWRVALWIAYRMALAVWYVTRPVSQGVYVAVWWNDQVLLIRNSYKNHETFPAGGVKRGESPRDAAVRELLEEVGIQLDPHQLTEAGDFQSRAEFKLDCSRVFETRFETRPEVQVDQREVISAEFVYRNQLAERELAPIAQQYVATLNGHSER